MSQCENHERLLQVALDFGWELYEYGTDSTCIVGGDAPHLALIWLQPCPWDQEQLIPVGCVCCTPLDDALDDWHLELRSVMDNRRVLKGVDPEMEMPLPESPPVLGPPPSFLLPYRAR